MTLMKVRCGLKTLPAAADNPKWDGSDEIPQYVTAKADDGSAFCRIEGRYKVSGKKPKVGWDDFGTLVTEDGTEYAEDDVSSQATNNLNRARTGCAPYLCSTLNPGKQIPILKIYQIPAGAKPTYINWPKDTLVSGAVYRFATR